MTEGPGGFHRIRDFGFLANGHRALKFALCRTLLAAPKPELLLPETYRERHRRLTGHDLHVYPNCGAHMHDRGLLLRRPARTRAPFWCDSL
jgi:hypothetical protein